MKNKINCNNINEDSIKDICISKYDKKNKKWIIFNFIQTIKDKNVFRKILITENGKCIEDEKIKLDKTFDFYNCAF